MLDWNEILEKSSMSPEDLAETLFKEDKKYKKQDFRSFRGICNKNKKGKDANYCPAISFIQLFLHCEKVITEIPTIKEKNLIGNYFQNILINNDKNPISMADFFSKWKGWNKGTIPTDFFDVSEFIEYFFKSAPIKIKKLFQFSSSKPELLTSSFIFYIKPEKDSLQNIINRTIDENHEIEFQNYLLVALLRKNEFYFDYCKININKHLQFSNQTYKFLGVVTFSDNHYHTIVKILNHYFLFDDECVCPLFVYKKCNEELFDLIKIIDYELYSKTSIVLYEKCNDKYDPDAFEMIIDNKKDNIDIINIAQTTNAQLRGFIKNCSANLQDEKEIQCQYSKYRKLFQITEDIFKDMNFTFDVYLFNNIQQKNEEDESIKKSIAMNGEKIRDILEKIVNKNFKKLDAKKIKKKLISISNFYNNNYKNLKRTDINYDSIINDSLTEISVNSVLPEIPNKHDDEITKNKGINKNVSEIDDEYKADTKSKYENCLIIDPIKSETFIDDNQFSLNEYKWENRTKIINVNEILNEMKQKFSGVKCINGYSSSDLRFLIENEMINIYLTLNITNKKEKVEFVHKFLEINSNVQTMSNNFKLYNQLHQTQSTHIFSSKLLLKKLKNYELLHFDEKEKRFSNFERVSKRCENKSLSVKITADTIKCLITLMIDFPSMSAVSYAHFINSIYGPNHNNPVNANSIQKYVREIIYTVSSSKFNPPSRNSIGSRLYRSAWCSIINDLLNSHDVLPVFIDEASIIACGSKKNSYSYVQIVPNINSKNTILSIFVMAIPNYGLIYKFKNGSINFKDHVKFINDSVMIIRKYIANDVEIVAFEDNTQIHNDDSVDVTMDKLKITILPIPFYSSALNCIIGNYLSILKTKIFVNKSNVQLYTQKSFIIQKWDEITYQLLDLYLHGQCFQEWFKFLHDSINGEPLND